LHTPPVVQANEYEDIRNSEGIRESYEYARDLDIIVTSAADQRQSFLPVDDN
jgi:hypothetical protein